MRSSPRIHLVYFLCLITALACAGCVLQANPFKDMASEPATTNKQQVEDYPNSQYQAGDEIYPAGYYIHTVSVPNENLSVIAKWYTGKQKNWVALVKCNPTIKPNHIFLGNKIKIPRSIMIRHTELPAKFVQQSHSGSQKKKTSKAPAQVQTPPATAQPAAEEKPTKPVEEEPLFFGPKGY